MLRANYIEKMGTGIKKMRRLVKKAGLKPIKFKFTNFTTLTFYRKPLPGGRGLAIKSSEVVAMDNLIEKLKDTLSVKDKRANALLQILYQIENNTFSRLSFSKKYNIPLRTLDRNVILLKKNNLISFEGSKRIGKHKVTEKYTALKKSVQLK